MASEDDGTDELASEEAVEPAPPPKPRRLTAQMILERCVSAKQRASMSEDHVADALLAVKRLRLSDMRIGSLDGLELCNGATHLYLQHNLISEIDGLEFFGKLEFLSLSDNKISAISGVRHLKTLQYLDLSFNQLINAETSELPLQLLGLDLSMNPCTKQVGHRAKLIAALPELVRLDDVQVMKWERGPDYTEEEAPDEVGASEEAEVAADSDEIRATATAASGAQGSEHASTVEENDSAASLDPASLYDSAMKLFEPQQPGRSRKLEQIRQRSQARRAELAKT
eukprot:6189344-Pleurochrysis_carterae.AAC.1